MKNSLIPAFCCLLFTAGCATALKHPPAGPTGSKRAEDADTASRKELEILLERRNEIEAWIETERKALHAFYRQRSRTGPDDKSRPGSREGKGTTGAEGESPDEKMSSDPDARHTALTAKTRARYHELFMDFERAIERNPESRELLREYGELLYSHGLLSKAAEVWCRASEISPLSADLENDIGVCLSHTGEPVEATRRFRRALEEEPNTAVFHFNLATIYFTSRYKVGESYGWALDETYWHSQEEYEAAFSLEPDNFQYAISCPQNYYMAHFFGINDIWDKALAAWKRCLRDNFTPDQHKFVYANMGRVCMKMGKNTEAREYLRKAMQLGPSPQSERLLERLDKSE